MKFIKEIISFIVTVNMVRLIFSASEGNVTPFKEMATGRDVLLSAVATTRLCSVVGRRPDSYTLSLMKVSKQMRDYLLKPSIYK